MKSRGASSGRKTSSSESSASRASIGKRDGPAPGTGRGEDAQDHEREPGCEERLLLGGLREEVAVPARLDRLVLANANVGVAPRTVKRRVRQVDDEAGTGLAGGLDERPEPRRVQREAHRAHDRRGAVLGEEPPEEVRVRAVPSRHREARVARHGRGPLLLLGAALAGVVERVEEDDLLARPEKLAHEGGAEEARASGDEDPAHGTGVGPGALPAASS